jgi:hypothetical protein
MVLLVRSTSSSRGVLRKLLKAARAGAITRAELDASHARIDMLRAR